MTQDTTETTQDAAVESTFESQIDGLLLAATGKSSEIEHVQAAIIAIADDLAAIDEKTMHLDDAAARLELDARLSGTKPPKSNGEADALHGTARRLRAALQAAEVRLDTLAVERAELLNTADLLAKNISRCEYSEQAGRVSELWKQYETAFADLSAAAQLSGEHSAWNSDATFSPFSESKWEPINGQRCRLLDYDGVAMVAALARSNAARVAAKIDACR